MRRTKVLPKAISGFVEKKTAGRGRLDRTWESSLGGIWMSLLLRPAIPPALVPSLTLVAALALAQAIQETTGLPGPAKMAQRCRDSNSERLAQSGRHLNGNVG